MIDASAMVEALVGRDAEDALLEAVAGDPHAPHLLDLEVLSVLRGLVRGRRLDPAAAEAALTDYFGLQINRYEAGPLAERIWQLRHRYGAYDASYLALAEALDATLVSCDAKLAAGGHRATVRLVGSPSRP